MRKNKTCIVFAGLLLLLNMGCSDVFDQPRIGAVTPEQAWNDPEYVSYYVNQFYGILPAWNRNEAYTEEAGNINAFLNGKMQTSSGFPDGVDWSTAYSRIRSMNVFFENIDKVTGLVQTEKNELMGQVYFFRAYQYYQMVKVYGGVPIIEDVQDPSDFATTKVARNSTVECFEYIVNDLNKAIEYLPGTWDGSNSGRISKGAAMAVKGQVLMLKASPIFCPAQNHPEFWTAAYTACNDALTELKENGYGLYTTGGKKDYEQMHYDKTGAANEMVLFVKYADPLKRNGFQASQRPLSVSAGNAGGCQPTWEMALAYPMLNGKNITDPTSGYDSNYFWVGRDPRFYQTIVYNSAIYGFGSDKSRIQWTYPGLLEDGYLGSYQRSGLYCRKFIDTTLVTSDLSKQAFDWPIIRYAEVLLDVAECAAETNNMSVARENIILIRKRAGITDDGSGSYGLDSGVGSDYQATLDAIMKERQIELAYEGKRFWDLRRRRLFSELNSQITWHANGPYLADTKGTAADTTGLGLVGLSAITKYFETLILNPPDGVSADSIRRAITDYRLEEIDRSADNKIEIPDTYYFWPINPNDIQKDENLVQNVGWDNGTFDPTIH